MRHPTLGFDQNTMTEFTAECDAGVADGKQQRFTGSVAALEETKSGTREQAHAHQSALKVVFRVDVNDSADAARRKILQIINFLGSKCHVIALKNTGTHCQSKRQLTFAL